MKILVIVTQVQMRRGHCVVPHFASTVALTDVIISVSSKRTKAGCN